MLHQSIGDVRLRAHPVGVVGPKVQNLNLGALKCFLDPLEALLSVASVALSDKHHDLAALRQSLFNQFACLASGRDIVGAKVAGSVALRRVTVLSQQENLLCHLVDHLGLIDGIHRTDGHARHSLCQQIINYSPLLRRGAIRRNSELDIDVGQFSVGLFASFAGNGPKVGGIVGHKSEFLG